MPAATRTTGVDLAALSATYNMAHPDRTQRNYGLRALMALAPAAQTLGIPLLTL